MNPQHAEERIALGAGGFAGLSAVGLYALAAWQLAGIPSFFVVQTGNLLLIAAGLCLLSAGHAYLRRLATEEETDARRNDNSSAGLFDSALDNQGRQQRAFGQFQKVIVPIILLLLSGLEASLAIRTLRQQAAGSGSFREIDLTPFLGVAASLAVIAFVAVLLAKYCSGLAYNGNCHYLRPVCAALFGGFLACTLAAGASLLMYWENTQYDAIATWCASLLALFLAGERVLLWILDLYRPQSQRMAERPIYESRVLGVFSQPRGVLDSISDLVAYQFGVQLSERLLYRGLTRMLLPFLGIQLLTLMLLTSIVYIHPHQVGLQERWRNPELVELPPGLHVCAPWPFSRTYRLPIQRTQTLRVAMPIVDDEVESQSRNDIWLWDDQGLRRPLFLAGTEHTDEGQNGDAPPVNLAHASVTVQYRITNPIHHLQQHADPSVVLRHLARSELGRLLLAHDLNQTLAQPRSQVGQQLKTQLAQRATEQRLGVEVMAVVVDHLQPPVPTVNAYRDKLAALDDRRRTMSVAQQFAKEAMADGEQRVNQLLREAESENARLTAVAAVEAETFAAKRELYRRYPKMFRTREILDAVEDWLSDARKIVVTSDNARQVYNLDLKQGAASLLSTFDEMPEAEKK